MIYTSYFANMRYLSETDIKKCISIALAPPPGYTGAQYKKLAPLRYILKDYQIDKNEEKYKRNYIRQVLNNLDPYEIAKELDGKILLCFETPEKFCHRHLVAEWFNSAGIDCGEIVPHNKEIIVQQPSLF